MDSKIRNTLAAMLLLSSCATSSSLEATLFPVEGPMSLEVPVPSVPLIASGVRSYSGEMTLAMPDGEVCSGKWAIARGKSVSQTSGRLLSQYGWVHGRTTTVSTDSNPATGAGVLTCNRGRMIDVEFVTGAGTGSGYGVAKDNRGNIFRVIF